MEKHISEIINVKRLQSLLDKFTAATGTGTSVIDKKGKILVSTAWQEICIKFHRNQDETCKNCVINDTVSANKIKKQYSNYKCPNGLTNVAMPIIVNNKTIGTLFIGPFFSKNPDFDYFRSEAEKFNYNEIEYFKALSTVQIISDAEVKKKIDLLSELTFFLADLGASNIELMESKKETLKMMQEAEESEHTFKKLFEDSSDAILLIDKTGVFVECNQAALRLLKMTRDKFLFHSPNNISPKNQPNGRKSEEAALDMINLAYENGLHRFDWTHINADGGEFIVEVSLMPIVVKGETMLHTTWRDITERIKNEIELKNAKENAEKNEAQFRQLFENMDEGFALHEMIYDKNNKPIDYRFINLNDGFEKLTGLKKADLIGKRVTEIMPNVEQLWINNYGNVAKTGVPYHFENYSQELDKHYNVVAYSPRKDFFAVIFSDVTQVKKFQNELITAKEKAELNESRLIEAQSVAKIGNWETNLLTMEVLWSDETYNIFELDKEKFQNSHPSFLNYVHPDDIGRVEDAFSKSFSSTSYHSVQHRIITPLNKIKHVEENWRIIHDEDKKPITAFGTCQDITKIKQFELELIKSKEKAEESDRLKSAFLANMSHEIRTPMNGILGFSELLKNPNLTGEKQQDYIKIIEKSGLRMLNIINDIIDISKIEAGLMKVDITDTNINEKIKFIYKFFKPQVEEKGMQLLLNSDLPTNEIIIKTDTEKLYSVLTNLVKNAIKYSDQGEIEIGYSIKGETLEFYVKDSGIGIPKNRLDAIFERFIQADVLDKLARQGAGLGLSISKAYINMLGGEIWVKSEISIGSTFYFTLPYTTKSENKNDIENNLELNNEDFTAKSKKLKILIAEDDETSELLISIMVEDISKEIITAKTGNEAVAICKANPDIDLILMDIQMPEMNGYETTKLIREFNKDVIIIAQTAYGLAGDREKALEIGCNDYISKPIKQPELLSLINKFRIIN